MTLWLDGYEPIILGADGGPYDRADHPKLCWHTTEGGSLAGAETAFYSYPPHLGVDPDTGARHQYIDLDRRAYSLGNSDAEDSYVIQVEVVGYAAESHEWPPARLKWLADNVVTPVQHAVGVPPVIAPQGFHGQGEGIVLASPSSPIRMTLAEWDGFAGHVGHQHCPGDDHWDPGRLDVAAILAADGGPPPAPPPAYRSNPEDPMAASFYFPNQPLWELFHVNHDGEIWHSYYPAEHGGGFIVGNEMVGRGAKPSGPVSVTRATTPSGNPGRGDVYAETPTGAWVHFWQDAPRDYTWNLDSGAW